MSEDFGSVVSRTDGGSGRPQECELCGADHVVKLTVPPGCWQCADCDSVWKYRYGRTQIINDRSGDSSE